MTKTLMCAIAMIAATTPALAQYRTYDDGIDARQYRLEQRVEDGRRTGELTRDEYGRLRRELRLIARDEQAFRADGHLSQREWQQLNARLDGVSRQVYYERHDSERRGRPYNDYRADRRF